MGIFLDKLNDTINDTDVEITELVRQYLSKKAQMEKLLQSALGLRTEVSYIESKLINLNADQDDLDEIALLRESWKEKVLSVVNEEVVLPDVNAEIDTGSQGTD